MTLRFTRFNAEDFPVYRSWYEDPDLNRHLGPPIDQEWLDCVTAETNGCQYSVFENDMLVAVVGVKFPNAEHPRYAITDLAVKPQLRGRGIGSHVLDTLMSMHALKPGESWFAVVSAKNPRAKSFLEKNGWTCKSDTPDENGMLEITFGLARSANT